MFSHYIQPGKCSSTRKRKLKNYIHIIFEKQEYIYTLSIR